MKTILSRLSNDKAQKELQQFTIAAATCALISLFAFWALSVVAFAFSVRGLLLTYHKGNKDRKNLLLFRIANALTLIVAVIVGLSVSTKS